MKPAEPVTRMVWLFCDIFCNEVKACAGTSGVDDAKILSLRYKPLIPRLNSGQARKKSPCWIPIQEPMWGEWGTIYTYNL